MHGHLTPLVLVVCDDPERAYRLRVALRRDGFLPAFARSAGMAAALFAQIRIDAVALFPSDALGDLTPLQAAALSSRKIRTFYVGEQAPFSDWTACVEEELPGILDAALRGPAPA